MNEAVTDAVVMEKLEQLDERSTRLFACDCAEHVLPFFLSDHYNDTRPAKAIDVARRYARGKTTKDELKTARNDAMCSYCDCQEDIRNSHRWYSKSYAASSAANAAAMSAYLINGGPRAVIRCAVEAAYCSVYHTMNTSYAEADRIKQQELEWQYQKLLQYLNNKIP